ncbi:hypothetical protein AOQ84DRAFT_118561 [Glonium stellatum]|uniref:Uncharacterized protein n=1 Tax=Glonium stellatum TaxID=574774 RepID=A0A8E2FDU3_9PEZI|nr:hypothetical protein AOQ84DRAFT_118561 [Glonium stellatum]
MSSVKLCSVSMSVSNRTTVTQSRHRLWSQPHGLRNAGEQLNPCKIKSKYSPPDDRPVLWILIPGRVKSDPQTGKRFIVSKGCSRFLVHTISARIEYIASLSLLTRMIRNQATQLKIPSVEFIGYGRTRSCPFSLRAMCNYPYITTFLLTIHFCKTATLIF